MAPSPSDPFDESEDEVLVVVTFGDQGPPGPPGPIGGGAAGAPVSGSYAVPTLIAPALFLCIAVDLRSEDCAIDFSGVTWRDGVTYQFDLVLGTYAALFRNAPMAVPSSDGSTTTSFDSVGGGQSVVFKWNAALGALQTL